MSELVAALEALGPDQRRRAYARLWFELTIVARAVWSDERYADAQKLDGLKWINEIQHRVWHGYMDPPGYSPARLLDRIDAHVRHAPHIAPDVYGCIRNAVASVVRA